MVKWQDVQGLIDNKKSKPKTGLAVGASVVSAAVGATAGILLAPRSGKETRAKLKRKAKSAVNKGQQKAADTKDSAKEKASQATSSTKRPVNRNRSRSNRS